MVPTYFRRELRDRVLQRLLRLRALFLCCRRLISAEDPALLVIPREGGVSSTPRLRGSIASVSGILDRPPSRTMTTNTNSTFRSHVGYPCNSIEIRPPHRGPCRTRCAEPGATRRRRAGDCC